MFSNVPHNYRDCRENDCGNTLFRSGDVTSSWVITLSAGRLYVATSFAAWLRSELVFNTAHSSKTKILCLMRIPHIWGVGTAFCLIWLFLLSFFPLFSPVCVLVTISFTVRLHDSISEEGFHYLVFDLWVTVSLSPTIFVNFVAVSHLIVFSLKTCVFV